MRSIKNIVMIISFLFLISCGGGGSSGGSSDSPKPSVKTESFSIDGKDISETVIHSIGDASIEMTNINNTPITIKSIKLNNELDTINSNSTCLNKTLKQNETCSINLVINGVYTSNTNIAMTLFTDSIAINTQLSIWNYLYTNNITDQSKKLQFSTITTLANSNGYVEIKQLGTQEIKITNAESSPVFITKLNYQGAVMKVDQGVMIPNYLISNLNTCGGTLLSGASCSVFVNFNAIQNGQAPNADVLEVWYKSGNIANKVSIGNGVQLQNLLSINCNSLGNCPIYSKSIVSHKLALSNLVIDTPDNIDATTNTTNGCIGGFNFESSTCNIKLSLRAYPIGAQSTKVSAYVKYYVDDNYTVTFFIYADGYIHLDNTQTQQFEISAPSLYANSYFDDDGMFVSNGKAITIVNPRNNSKNMTIKKITFIPAKTNYQDVDTQMLISSESAISQDKCTGTTLQPTDEKCTVNLASGMNAYGDMGSLSIDFTIDGITQVFNTMIVLGKVQETNLNISVSNPDPSIDDLLPIWKTGNDISKPINIIASRNYGLVQIANYNNDSGTYVLLDNYSGKLMQTTPSCLGYEPNKFYMYPSKNYFCGYRFDLSSKAVANIVPLTLILGNHKEIKLNINWQIVDHSKNYVKPILKGNVK